MDELIRALADIIDEYRDAERHERPDDYTKGYLKGLADAAEIAARALHRNLGAERAILKAVAAERERCEQALLRCPTTAAASTAGQCRER